MNQAFGPTSFPGISERTLGKRLAFGLDYTRDLKVETTRTDAKALFVSVSLDVELNKKVVHNKNDYKKRLINTRNRSVSAVNQQNLVWNFFNLIFVLLQALTGIMESWKIVLGRTREKRELWVDFFCRAKLFVD